MGIIEAIDIQLVKKDQLILDKVSFAVAEGDMTAVMGPSGAGKSSLLRVLNLLHSPSSGMVLYQGKNTVDYDIRELRRQVGYVLQKPYLFGTSVRDNIEYPYQLLGRKTDFTEINSYLEKVNLPSSVMAKNNSELSGGEQQRVALVRSLLVKPKVLLLDEVTASLDEQNSELIEQLILAENRAKFITVLFITHHADQAKKLANTVLYLVDGRLSFNGPTEEYFRGKGDGLNE